MLLKEEALFEFFLPKDVLWMNVMISCYALSHWADSSAVLFTWSWILKDSTLGAKDFFFFS